MMAKLESLSRIVAYMNNRAVSLIRANQFENGIDLYKKTRDALPSKSSKSHDVITYNLGLALARYGDLTQATATLSSSGHQWENLLIQKKAGALARRIRRAVKSGDALNLAEGPLPLGPTEALNAAEDHTATDLSTIVIDIKRGDLCCHLLFNATSLFDDRVKAHLKNSPRFQRRDAIAWNVETRGLEQKRGRNE